MMTFEQIRSLAVLEPEQADEQADIARPRVRDIRTGDIGTLIGVDDDGTARIDPDELRADYTTPFRHLEAA